MFYHGFDNYMNHAFPEDELRPVSCKPLTRDRENPHHIELNDPLGNYSLTLIDSLSTLAILASSEETFRTGLRWQKRGDRALRAFQDGVIALVELYGDGTSGKTGQGTRSRGFDLDSKVQVFETVIRGLGGLLSAHLFAVGELPIRGYNPSSLAKGQGTGSESKIKWSKSFTYDGQLLRLAHDLGRRLLPVFSTSTGIPYPRVNLRHGIPFYTNSPLNQDAAYGQCNLRQQPDGELTETCSAGSGSLLLEMTVLSRLTGDQRFELLGKRAFWAIWERRSSVGLIGSGIDAETGLWTSSYTGLGAGIDSFFEYAAKAAILLSASPFHHPTAKTKTYDLPLYFESKLEDFYHMPESYLQVWNDAHAAIRRHLYRGKMYIHPHYIQADLNTGAARAFWVDSLSAFFPGLLAITGDLDEAIETHLLFTALWTRYSALPERWSTSNGGVEGGLGWWVGRPEFIESTYHIYRATKDPWYLHIGEMVLRDIRRRCWTKCGWSGLQDVRSGELNDRMESFLLGETAKYLYLLFSPDHPLNRLDAPFVFTTEGHPLIIPRLKNPKPHQSDHQPAQARVPTRDGLYDTPLTCPAPLPDLPFSISRTAARGDVYHAANLARLHLMPSRESVDSPIVEFSSDHPSISVSDIRSPSNYTLYPWTLPLDIVPYNATCEAMMSRPTFDVTFPAQPNIVFGPGLVQRVTNGIMVNSMSGLRLGMIQDVPVYDTGSGDGDSYRIQAINNVALGKDEKIYMSKHVISSVVSPVDPNFKSVRDITMLDILIDSNDGEHMTGAKKEKSNSSSSTDDRAASDAAASNVKQAFDSFRQRLSSILHDQNPASDSHIHRDYVPAMFPTGTGAAPLPDVEDSLGPDMEGRPQGSLPWQSIYLTNENCDEKIPMSIVKEHQVIVMKRGRCSFIKKLSNVATFAPNEDTLQLVIVVSYDQEDEADLEPGQLIRPLLDSAQFTSSGLPRHNPIAMVMIGGGEHMYQTLAGATAVGIKRRYSMQAQGVPISNLIVI